MGTLVAGTPFLLGSTSCVIVTRLLSLEPLWGAGKKTHAPGSCVGECEVTHLAQDLFWAVGAWSEWQEKETLCPRDPKDWCCSWLPGPRAHRDSIGVALRSCPAGWTPWPSLLLCPFSQPIPWPPFSNTRPVKGSAPWGSVWGEDGTWAGSLHPLGGVVGSRDEGQELPGWPGEGALKGQVQLPPGCGCRGRQLGGQGGGQGWGQPGQSHQNGFCGKRHGTGDHRDSTPSL